MKEPRNAHVNTQEAFDALIRDTRQLLNDVKEYEQLLDRHAKKTRRGHGPQTLAA